MPEDNNVSASVEEIIKQLGEKLDEHSKFIHVVTKNNDKIRDAETREKLSMIAFDLVSIRRKLSAINQLHQILRENAETLKKKIIELGKKIESFGSPPLTYATVITVQNDKTVDVLLGGRHYRLKVIAGELIKKIVPGDRVLTSESDSGTVIVGIGNPENIGEIGVIDSVLDNQRMRVVTSVDEKRVYLVAGSLSQEKFSIGDEVRCSPAGFVVERLQKSENKKLWLEKIEQIEYSQIGGLAGQVEKIRKEIEQPFLHKPLYNEYDAEASKGVLLYGPPGCGKTLIAKAIAWQLAKKLAEVKGLKKVEGYFLNIKGPELLNKFVGETERQIREMFADARERATEVCPVIIFLDEADSLLKTRGSGISSDVEMTTTPQFLTMLDGVESNKNIIVVLASNRQDLIDPAVLRPGRIDCKIRVQRPDREGAKEIFRIYLTRREIPLHLKYSDEKHPLWQKKYCEFKGDRQKITDYLIDGALNRLWANDENKYEYKDECDNKITAQNSILELTLASGGKRLLYLRDLVSGAVIKNIVNRAKKNAIERVLVKGSEHGGVMTKDLCVAIEQEMIETEDLPNTKEDAKNWLDIEGINERIVHIESLVAMRRKELVQKPIEKVTTGHYL